MRSQARCCSADCRNSHLRAENLCKTASGQADAPAASAAGRRHCWHNSAAASVRAPAAQDDHATAPVRPDDDAGKTAGMRAAGEIERWQNASFEITHPFGSRSCPCEPWMSQSVRDLARNIAAGLRSESPFARRDDVVARGKFIAHGTVAILFRPIEFHRNQNQTESPNNHKQMKCSHQFLPFKNITGPTGNCAGTVRGLA